MQILHGTDVKIILLDINFFRISLSPCKQGKIVNLGSIKYFKYFWTFAGGKLNYIFTFCFKPDHSTLDTSVICLMVFS